jgi:hypothetical protein
VSCSVEADLITAPDYVVIKAANEFKEKTTAINQLWQTDFTCLKIIPSCLLWLPPVVQEVFPFEHVIECGLLSGLDVRRFQEPLAGMVICGSGPYLMNELICSKSPPEK